MEILAGAAGEGALAVLDFDRPPGTAVRDYLSQGTETPMAFRFFVRSRGKLQYKANRRENGVTWLELPESGLRLQAGPGSFTQVNRAVNHQLVNEIISMAAGLESARILDLYAGLGNFSLPLARAAARVTAVEESPYAVADAEENLRRSGLKNVEIIKGDAVKVAARLAKEGRRYDLVVLDPPRAGARGLASTLVRLEPRMIVYVSCHPAAMGRDLAEFASLGFYPEALTALDMFPQTAHLEVLARLVRN